MECPVMYLFKHKKMHADAISAFVPARWSGMPGQVISAALPPDSFSSPGVPSMGPGATQLQRIPYSPHSIAMVRVSASMAAFAATGAAWYHVAVKWRVAVMLVTTPPNLDSLRLLKAADVMLNMPKVSISMTVLKPFDDNCSDAARKLPAAEFTRMSSEPKAERAFSTAALQSSGFRMSPATASTRMPSFAKRAAASSKNFCRRPIMTTPLAPWSPNCRAISKPIPLPPPVIKATLPSRASGL
mmetsp:Transcript_1924/g.7329  ORF Transcript_1924/g.7329 Transcript_1924/m.7329 type:complete len:243 (-) Transcript_1924:108-836(-)